MASLQSLRDSILPHPQLTNHSSPFEFPWMRPILSSSHASKTTFFSLIRSEAIPRRPPSLRLSMATTSLQSLHQSFLRHHHHHHCFTNSPVSIFFKPSKSYKLFSNLSSSLSTASSAAPTSTGPFDALASRLSSSDFREADEETRRLLIALAGEAAQTRGYVFFSEVQFIPAADLQAIDRLWQKHSGGRFGYSVQRRLWEKSDRDFTSFFIRVGWMKKLDSEVVQYGYRSFPSEFIWELNDGTPEGHLPLTNALRGTQLLRSILLHPAFEESTEEGEDEKSEDKGVEEKKPNLMGVKRIFKTDYSF